MKRIALCPCGFEPATERPIQAARVVARFGDPHAGNVLEGDTVGRWRASFDAAAGRLGRGEGAIPEGGFRSAELINRVGTRKFLAALG